MRTTIYIPTPLHQRLKMVSKRKKKSVSQLVREAVDKSISADQEQDLDTIYKGFMKLRGLAGKGARDASTTIDEVLYGEHGAWRGSEK